jgi:ketosteroid isomerase-like protein
MESFDGETRVEQTAAWLSPERPAAARLAGARSRPRPVMNTWRSMSQQNVDAVKRLMDAFLGAEPTSALELLDPEVEFDSSARPDGRLWSGHEGVRGALLEWTSAWEDWSMEIESYLDVDDERVLFYWREQGTGKGSGMRLQQAGATVVTLRDGRVVRLRAYVDRSQARADVGLAD